MTLKELVEVLENFIETKWTLAAKSDLCLSISTTHLTSKDGELILQKDSPYLLAIEGEGESSFFYVPLVHRDANEEAEELRQELKSFGYSFAFINIFLQAQKEKIYYLRFCSSGAVINDLPRFDWYQSIEDQLATPYNVYSHTSLI